MPTQPIEIITWIEGETVTITIQTAWITEPIGKLSDLKARAKLYKDRERE